MKFYAYLPDKNGNEPLGSFNKLLFQLKTISGARRKVDRIFNGENHKLFSYTNFYDDKTFKDINK
jgi:hypothetical protein